MKLLNIISLIAIAGIVIACGGPLKSKGAADKRLTNVEDGIDPEEAKEQELEDLIPALQTEGSTPGAITPPSLEVPLRPDAPRAFLLDAPSLEEALRPIFGSSPRYNSDTGYFSPYWMDVRLGTRDIYFMPQERFALGTFDILGLWNPVDWLQFNSSRMTNTHEITQEYLFALRSFFAGACTKLYDEESPQAGNLNNLLVKTPSGTAPSALQIDTFMTAMFAYSPEAGELHPGAAEYAELFQDSLVDLPDGLNLQEAWKNNYLLLCISVGNDPRVYIR
jgi:hypothetical protein